MSRRLSRALSRLVLGAALLLALTGCYVTDAAVFTDRPALDTERMRALFSARYFELERRGEAAEDPRRQIVLATRVREDGLLDFVVYQDNDDVAGRAATLRLIAERMGVLVLWVQLPADPTTGGVAQKLIAVDGERLLVSPGGRGRFARPLPAAVAAEDVETVLTPALAALARGDVDAAFVGWSAYRRRSFAEVEAAIGYLAGPRSIERDERRLGLTLVRREPRPSPASTATCDGYARWVWFLRPRACR